MPKSGKGARTLLVLAGKQHNLKARHRVVSHPKRKKTTHNPKDNLLPITSATMRGREVTSAIWIRSRVTASGKYKDKNHKEIRLFQRMR